MVLVVGQNSTWQNSYTLRSLRTGAVNRISSVFASAAGKGANTVRALKRLGKAGLLLAYAGGPNGRKFTEACARDGIPAEFTVVAGETRVCTTLIEESGAITELVEPGPEIDTAEREAFQAAFDRRLGEADFLVIAGTAVAGETQDCYLRFARSAHERRLPVLLDSYREHGRLALSASPEILKINGFELAELSELPVSSVGERADACRALMDRFGVRWVIVTRGPDGAEGFDGRRSVAATPPRVEPVNTIGSGDSFTAGVVSSVMDQLAGAKERAFPDACDIAEAVRLGAAMGTANCLNVKPGWIEAGDLERVIERTTVR